MATNGLSTTFEVGQHDRDSVDNATTPASKASFADVLDSRDPVIFKSIFLSIIVLINFAGNGITLTTIRLTPKLQTKTFAILASLTVADLMTGVTMIPVIVHELVVYVFEAVSDPCRSMILLVAMAAVPRYPPYVSIVHAGLISIERYIAIVHPLQYEMRITDSTIKVMLAFGWIFPGTLAASFFVLFGRIDWVLCVAHGMLYMIVVADTVCLTIGFSFVIVLNWRMLMVALKQHAKINAEMEAVKFQPPTATTTVAVTTKAKKHRKEMKSLRLTVCVVGALVLWIPYIVGNLILLTEINSILGQFVAGIGLALGIVNSCINWIIYGAVSRGFRHSVWRMLGLRKHQAQPTATEQTRSSVATRQDTQQF